MAWKNCACRGKSGQGLQEKVERTLSQIQQDGLTSIYDFEMINYIGQVWINLMNLLSSYTVYVDEEMKGEIVYNLLKLYDVGQISEELFARTIVNL